MTNNKYESAKQYIENCKRNGHQSENKPRKDSLYPMHGCQIYLDDKDATTHEGVIQQTANRKVEQQKQLMRDGFNPVSPKIPQAEEQKNCPYCHPPYIGIGGGDIQYDKDGEGIFVKEGKIIALADSGCIRFEEEIKVCPKCGRKLEK